MASTTTFFLYLIFLLCSTLNFIPLEAPPPDFSTKVTYDPDSDLYIASYSIGTPPQNVLAFVDTASDVIWTNSKTAFKSASSTTYAALPCDDKSFCQKLNQKTCKIRSNQNCTYKIKYSDQASTSGVISQDKFSFDAKVDVGILKFGYATDTSPNYFEGKDINGCLGLSGITPFSFISQLGIKKFSHCFVKTSSKSTTMYFGSKAVITAKDSIPLVDTKYYYVKLNGISVGNTIVNLTNQPGRIYVDTGATYSRLKKAVYDPFLKLIKEEVVKPVAKSPHDFLEFCFKATKAEVDNLPKVTFQFADNKVNVSFVNGVTYLEFDGGVWCLAIIRSTDSESLLGNFQLANLNVGYDIGGKLISFTNMNC
ncbi:aspartic proteinase nepenthesin-1-like [Arachis duranensis]|uniref:Aspartic proteinase nepenthesin-1-like n=1 Tax=Arachis duranensis TaxID=130453 RepID=A0A6P4BQ62_ARADU|nr:aspartic proteinase nepenthesin-1-like [Arachis duranensis]